MLGFGFMILAAQLAVSKSDWPAWHFSGPYLGMVSREDAERCPDAWVVSAHFYRILRVAALKDAGMSACLKCGWNLHWQFTYKDVR